MAIGDGRNVMGGGETAVGLFSAAGCFSAGADSDGVGLTGDGLAGVSSDTCEDSTRTFFNRVSIFSRRCLNESNSV